MEEVVTDVLLPLLRINQEGIDSNHSKEFRLEENEGKGNGD